MENNQENNISNPHDHYFKTAMSDHRVAKEFFEAFLPQDLLPFFDLSYLKPEKGSYVDDMRKEFIADMLFKTKIKNEEAYLYLIVDHQSTPDKLMPFRVLKYVTNIIDQHLKATKTKSFPLVVPLVVYHGKRAWKYSTDIKDLINAPRNLIDELFLKPFKLIDLNLVDDEELKAKVWSGAMALTLKHAFEPNMMPFLHGILALLKKIEQLNGSAFAQDTLVYIITTTQINDKKAFVDLVKHELSTTTGEKIMTIAEQFKFEGSKETIHEVAKRMLAQGFDLNVITQITQLPITELKSFLEIA